MNVPAASGPSPTARFLLRNFVIYNPLFPFSAMLVLGAAWLLNPAQSDGGRAVPLLLQLLGVIGLYQVALLGAAGVLWRRGGLERDVRGLVLVLTPFLLDVTFTASSLTVTLVSEGGVAGAAALIAALITVTLVEMRIAAGLLGQRFDAPTWLALALGPALALGVPALGAGLALEGRADAIGLVVGGLLAGYVLLVGLLAGEEGGRDTLRRIAPLALAAALAHALMSAWTYQAPLLHVIGPVLIALGAVAPRLVPALREHEQALGAAVPALGALLCGLPQALAGGPPDGAWTVGLLGLVGVHAVLLWRHRSLPFLTGLLGGALLASGGTTLATSFAAIGTNPLEPLVLAVLFGVGLWRKEHPALLALPLCLGGLRTAQLGLLPSGLDVILGLDLIGLGILAYAHRAFGRDVEGATYRVVGATLLFLPACVVALAPTALATERLALLLAGGGILALLVLAGLTRTRLYAWPALLFPLHAAISLAPSSAQGWGVLGLLGAFGLVCLGVVVSLKREQVLRWLAELEEAEAAAGQPVERARPAPPRAAA